MKRVSFSGKERKYDHGKFGYFLQKEKSNDGFMESTTWYDLLFFGRARHDSALTKINIFEAQKFLAVAFKTDFS